MWFFILLLILFLVWFFVLRKFKVPKIGSLVLVTGGVKCGKSTFSVYTAIKIYKKNVRSVRFRNFFRKLLRKDLIEEPLLYSNVPLNMPYSPLTYDLLLRKKRFVKGSVCYIQEASLVADSQLIRDIKLNNDMLIFYKLIGHELGSGGSMIIDTQVISDLHYSIKRSTSQYFYVHHTTKLFLLPFVVCYLREMYFSEDNSTTNVFNKDLEDDLQKVLVPKWVWKKFDAYAYSSLTDDLPVDDNLVFPDDLKVNPEDFVTFNPYRKEQFKEYAQKKR